jgi:flagellar hook-associated protein 1 FlgK
MSISGALSNAMTGLRAAGRASQVVSSNISNAMTPGYGVRGVALTASMLGGVRIEGITRHSNPALSADYRLASADHGQANDRMAFLSKLESLVGTPENPASLSARIATFESSLISAASRPDAPERLNAALMSAQDIVNVLAQASFGVQNTRSAADQQISDQVSTLNSGLAQVRDLNAQITKALSQGTDTTALQDMRQKLVDDLNAIVPMRQIPRENGHVALYSTGGAILLDGAAATISFDPSNQITAYQSLAAGTLSGLEINGVAIRTDSVKGALIGGTLGAQFEIRDELAPQAQVQLDALARDLVERFQDSSVDPTLLPGDAGLFTDGGLPFDPLAETGLSQRLTLNAAVDPAQGGQNWRLRDGLNAGAPGDVGDARQIQRLSAALTSARTPSNSTRSLIRTGPAAAEKANKSSAKHAMIALIGNSPGIIAMI